MSTHITFLTSGLPVCSNPELLGHDFVTTQHAESNMPCMDCLDILTKHNMDQLNDEKIFGMAVQMPPEDPNAAGRGLVIGLLISSVFWAIVLFLYWYTYVR